MDCDKKEITEIISRTLVSMHIVTYAMEYLCLLGYTGDLSFSAVYVGLKNSKI